MTKAIKFGTDGWRAIIADDFTVENVARVTTGTALWLKNNFSNPSVVIGHDCRFAGALFADTVARVMIEHGIEVRLSKGFVSTPMISLAAKHHNCSLGIIITASHNPPSYNGFKLKGHYGGPLLPEKIDEIEKLIPDTVDGSSFQIQWTKRIRMFHLKKLNNKVFCAGWPWKMNIVFM
jgi:phosphomannomutase